MKLVLFSGSHPRHLFLNKEVIKHFDEILVFLMERESLLPTPPINLLEHDKYLFNKHFKERSEVEKHTYGDLQAEKVFSQHTLFKISKNELNTEKVASIIKDYKPDLCFIFGVGLILDPTFAVLPKEKINLHLGLSPWFKGSATLFWPFYHLMPQFCGSTFHYISKEADAGEIIHQCVPKLEIGDGIHDVGAKCVLKAAQDLPLILDFWKRQKTFKTMKQKTSGRNWRGIDFHASQLRLIYDLFENKIVDKYLEGELVQKVPNLYSCFNN